MDVKSASHGGGKSKRWKDVVVSCCCCRRIPFTCQSEEDEDEDVKKMSLGSDMELTSDAVHWATSTNQH